MPATKTFLVCVNNMLALWAAFLLGKIDDLLSLWVSNRDRQQKKIKKQAFRFRLSATLMWLPRHCLETQTLQHIWKSTVEWNRVLKQHVKSEKFMFMLKRQCGNRFQWKSEECIRDENGSLPRMRVQEFRPVVWLCEEEVAFVSQGKSGLWQLYSSLCACISLHRGSFILDNCLVLKTFKSVKSHMSFYIRSKY